MILKTTSYNAVISFDRCLSTHGETKVSVFTPRPYWFNSSLAAAPSRRFELVGNFVQIPFIKMLLSSDTWKYLV